MAARARYTILSMMKDEGHSLIEWVAYHRVLGFDNICVYTNNCNDGTDAMLIRLEQLGHVRHFRNTVPEGEKPQPHALNLADENAVVTNSDWILTMDADEFLSIKCGAGRVDDLVQAVPDDTDAIAITWRFFGSNGVTDWNPGLVTETYTRAAPDEFKKGWGVKTLFRPYENLKFGIHRPSIHGARKKPERAQALLSQKWVNGSGLPMPEDFPLSGWRSTKPTLGYALAEMNHYAVKSYEAYLLRRMRGNVNNKTDKYNAAYFAIFDRNEEDAPNVKRHVAATRALMADMLADAELATLYRAALDYHQSRVAQLRETGEYDAWLTELQSAAQVPLDRIDEVLFTQHLPRAWQEKVQKMREAGVPDREIALMISSSQTARKSETRAALRASAEGRPAPEETPSPDPEPAAVPSATAQSPAIASAPETATPRPIAPRAVKPQQEGDPRVRLVSTVKNEGPWLIEWIAYHQTIGVTDFTIFSNDCSDGTNLMLDRLDRLGVIRHFDNPIGERMDPQRRAYSRAGKMSDVRASDWVLILDADEFLNVKCGTRTIVSLIDACAQPDAISIPWRLMGSNGQERMDPAPVTRRFTRGSTFDAPENGMVWGFKTLFRPERFDYFGVHRPRFQKQRETLPPVSWTNASGDPMDEKYLRSGWRFNADNLGYAHAQVNHYALKSREEFLLKRLRGTANSKDKNRIDMSYWRTFDLNTNEDRSIPTDDLDAAIADLLSDADLAALHRASLDNAARRIADQQEDTDLRSFVAHGTLPEAAQ